MSDAKEYPTIDVSLSPHGKLVSEAQFVNRLLDDLRSINQDPVEHFEEGWGGDIEGALRSLKERVREHRLNIRDRMVEIEHAIDDALDEV